MSVEGSARGLRRIAPYPRRVGPRLGPVWAALLVLASLSPSRAADLEEWLGGLEAIPPRDAPALVALRQSVPDLEARLRALAAGGSPAERASATRALGALATDPAALTGLSGELAERARERVRARMHLSSQLATGLSLTEAAALDALAGDCLRELAGDPLGGSERLPALLALGARAEGRETLRRACAGGGPAASYAARGLTSLRDELGLSEALPAALERLDVSLTRELLAGIAQLEGAVPLARCRAFLAGEGSSPAKGTLARALAELGWREASGALRRLAREAGLSRIARVAVVAAYLRLGGAPSELGPDAAALLAAACSDDEGVSNGSAPEAFSGLALIAPDQAGAALVSVLQRPDAIGRRRARAIHAAEALGLSAVAAVLRELVRDSSQPGLARAAACHALGTFASSEDQAALLSTSQDPSPGLRRAALAALVRVPRSARISACAPAFAQAAGDAEPTVRRVALGALDSPQALARFESVIETAAPSVSDPDEARAWLEVACGLGLSRAGPAGWLLSRWSERSELRQDLALAAATLAFARSLPADLAVPALLELLEHPLKDATQAAHESLARRYPSGAEFDGDPARWRRAWREQPALFR